MHPIRLVVLKCSALDCTVFGCKWSDLFDMCGFKSSGRFCTLSSWSLASVRSLFMRMVRSTKVIVIVLRMEKKRGMRVIRRSKRWMFRNRMLNWILRLFRWSSPRLWILLLWWSLLWSLTPLTIKMKKWLVLLLKSLLMRMMLLWCTILLTDLRTSLSLRSLRCLPNRELLTSAVVWVEVSFSQVSLCTRITDVGVFMVLNLLRL